MTLAELIRTKRAEVGLSQAQLAAACGVRQATVSNWERNGPDAGHGPALRHARALAAALGVTVDELAAATD